MTNFESYAQVRIGFYQARFQSETNNQLVNDFNSLAASRGWTAERSYYTEALINELQRRGIDLSAIAETNTDGKILSIKNCRVQYDEKQNALIL
ncbi:MAG: hypothetical protein IKY31_00160 [Bacteroidaceae bacterium]|nr:hypothetical protein [Bacteroidaceae bacterium]